MASMICDCYLMACPQAYLRVHVDFPALLLLVPVERLELRRLGDRELPHEELGEDVPRGVSADVHEECLEVVLVLAEAVGVGVVLHEDVLLQLGHGVGHLLLARDREMGRYMASSG